MDAAKDVAEDTAPAARESTWTQEASAVERGLNTQCYQCQISQKGSGRYH